MTLSLFDQFISPVVFGIPLTALAIALPWFFFPTANKNKRWLKNRLLTVLARLIQQFVSQILLPLNMGGHKWALMFASLMMYIVTINTLGLLPYTYTPTTQLSMNLGLAFPLWLATIIIGMRDQPTHAIGHLLPEGTPTPLIPVLVIIETVSLLIRPLALGVRLTANLTAGHLLIQLMATGAFVLLSAMPSIAIATAALLFLLTILEVAVAVIQAYVFVLLLSLYLQENV
uniref:ATP synthase subunit a n=1 Tax=Paralichthyidae sp. TaxID=3075841 RepID=A0AA95Z3L4_9PLEU|nr:ATP synthase F0 subunit 6 [Citharichthys spilopterus]WNH37982.1 ATP synthase F0 subunit 6 [Paralichthyidae sp.]